MKTKLLFIFSALLLGTVQAQQKTSWSDLRKGDWLTLEYSRYYWNGPVIDFRIENSHRIDFKVTVLDKKGDVLQLSFKPFHIFCSKDQEKDRTYSFFDSSFPVFSLRDLGMGRSLYNGMEDSVIVSLNMHTFQLADTIFVLKDIYWQYGLDRLPYGIEGKSFKQYGYSTSWSSPRDIFKDLFEKCFDTGLKNKFPLASENTSVQLRVTDASFRLPPNVKILLSSAGKFDKSISEQSSFFYDLSLNYPQWYRVNAEGLISHRPDNAGNILFECFIPQPLAANLFRKEESPLLPEKIPLLLTPGDSIRIFLNANGKVAYTGEGAINCSYQLELEEKRPTLRQTMDLNDQKDQISLDDFLTLLTSTYKPLWKKYEGKVSPYWFRSSQLSYRYQYINAFLYYKQKGPLIANRVLQLSIPWEDAEIQSLKPFIDYMYQPEGYENFLKMFCTYKIEDLNREVLTSRPPSIFHSLDWYYLIHSLFSGYPRYFLLMENLKYMMIGNSLSYSEREYRDFITTYNHPMLLHEIENIRRTLLPIEPGQNIRDLHLKTEKYIPLDKTGEKYIFLKIGNQRMEIPENFSNAPSGVTYRSPILQQNENADWSLSSYFLPFLRRFEYSDLNDKIIFCHIFPTEEKDRLTTKQKESGDYLFADMQEILSDQDTLRIYHYDRDAFFLIRSDGTILSRSFKFSRLNSIFDLIREDMNRPRESKTEVNYVVIFSIIFSILSVAIVVYKVRIRSFRKREERKRLISELKLKAIRSQMNPHFIFNALASIQHLINQQKNEEANEYLLKFAQLLRAVLDSSERKLIPLSEEIKQIDLYLYLEQLRVPFTYQIRVDDQIRTDDESIPGMLIQPIVENAVIHGITPGNAGNIDIHFSMEDKILRVEITDDGPGFDPSVFSPKGFGLKATRERLEILNREFNTTIGMAIETNIPQGTKVIISIPV